MVIGAVSESEEQRSIPALADKLFYLLLGAGGGRELPGGPVQNILGGRGLAGGPVQRNVTYRMLLTPFPHRKLPLYQPFTVLQDAHGIYLALNKGCPRSHLHPWNNATLMPIMGITVWMHAAAFVTQENLRFYFFTQFITFHFAMVRPVIDRKRSFQCKFG